MAEDELETMKEILEALASSRDRVIISEMEAHYGDDTDPRCCPAEVMLYGFEGQVDAVMPIEGRPDTIERVLPIPLRTVREPEEYDPTQPIPCRKAVYRQVGQHTYQRES